MDVVYGSIVACAAVAASVLSYYISQKVYKKQQAKKKASKKREESRRALEDIRRSVAADDETTVAKRNGILSLKLPELRQQLQDGQLSAVQVLQAFQEKAIAVNDELNCLTEPVPNALVRAQQLDAAEQPSGLLHGVPVSIKDNFNIKGMATVVGVTKYMDTPVDEDAVIVQVLKKQGAVPFVRTNVPQALLSSTTSNPVFGETLNPVDPQRSPGGSSGGEAALIKRGGSVLGMGSDGLGSVRIPAHFSGVCGFKPTGHRISHRGLVKGSPMPGVVAAPGLLARDVDSLVLGMQALLVPDMFQLDPLVVPIPFKLEIYEDKRPMRIGYYTTLECFPPTPSMGRAVMIAKEALEKAGHTLVPFTPPDDEYACLDLVARLAIADNGRTFTTKWLKDELVDENVKGQMVWWTTPFYLRKILGFLLKPIWPRIGRTLGDRLLRSIYDLWQRLSEREDYLDLFLDEMEKNEIDLLLCPAFGMPAPKPEDAGRLMGAGMHTALFNLLNFPAGVVPVTMVTEEDDRLLDDWRGYGNDPLDKIVKKTTKGAVGLPIGVQCVALPWQEEKCLRLMKEVETLCGLS